jgi:hypothetical protein
MQYSDLFWALKGGGNNFGIVTSFDLLTYSSPAVCAGIIEVSEAENDTFLNAIANLGQLDLLTQRPPSSLRSLCCRRTTSQYSLRRFSTTALSVTSQH